MPTSFFTYNWRHDFCSTPSTRWLCGHLWWAATMAMPMIVSMLHWWNDIEFDDIFPSPSSSIFLPGSISTYTRLLFWATPSAPIRWLFKTFLKTQQCWLFLLSSLQAHLYSSQVHRPWIHIVHDNYWWGLRQASDWLADVTLMKW